MSGSHFRFILGLVSLSVYSSADSIQTLSSAGAAAAESPVEVAAECDRIVTMLPNSPHVRSVYSQLLSKAAPGTLFLDCSTIDPAVAKEMSELCLEKGTVFMDCPVSGGVGAATAGTLSFMVGGPSEELEAASSILEFMGAKIFPCGEVGTGQVAKICNNMMLGISMLGISETLNLGGRLGIDPKVLSQIINSASGRCWSSDTYNPVPGVIEGVPSSNGYKGGFGTTLMTKVSQE
jgi:3-hydroxyisobutyrate dehydrogenase